MDNQRLLRVLLRHSNREISRSDLKPQSGIDPLGEIENVNSRSSSDNCTLRSPAPAWCPGYSRAYVPGDNPLSYVL